MRSKDISLKNNLKPLLEFESGESNKRIFEFQLDANSIVINKAVKNIIFPPNTLVSMIQRNGDFLIPSGTTVLEENDIVFIFSDYTNEKLLRDTLGVS